MKIDFKAFGHQFLHVLNPDIDNKISNHKKQMQMLQFYHGFQKMEDLKIMQIDTVDHFVVPNSVGKLRFDCLNQSTVAAQSKYELQTGTKLT